MQLTKFEYKPLGVNNIPNLLGMEYTPFAEYSNALQSLLNRKTDIRMSEFLNYPVYKFISESQNSEEAKGNLAEHFSLGERDRDPHVFKQYYYMNTYCLAQLKYFYGTIPEANQREILSKVESLKKVPFISLQGLYVLAPANNFAFLSNAVAVDPIVFQMFKLNNITYLIPLTQWL